MHHLHVPTSLDMVSTKCCALAALVLAILAINVAPSQQQPVEAATGRRSLLNLPFAGLLSPSGWVNVVNHLKDLAGAVQKRDFLLAAMKTLDVFRSLLQAVNLPGLSEMDGIIELIHGFMESMHPFFVKLRETASIVRAEEIANGNGQLFDALRDNQSTVSLLTDGLKMLASLPAMLFNM